MNNRPESSSRVQDVRNFPVGLRRKARNTGLPDKDRSVQTSTATHVTRRYDTVVNNVTLASIQTIKKHMEAPKMRNQAQIKVSLFISRAHGAQQSESTYELTITRVSKAEEGEYFTSNIRKFEFKPNKEFLYSVSYCR